VAVTLYLLDTSAVMRSHHPEVVDVIDSLLAQRRVATCPILDLEALYTAPSPDLYEAMRADRADGYVPVPVDERVCARALEVQRELASTSRHRGASLPDLLVAACAERHGATVLHYDADYDLIAEVTGQPVQWVVPRGTVP
jgi:predicted nucleic acid-binding protein